MLKGFPYNRKSGARRHALLAALPLALGIAEFAQTTCAPRLIQAALAENGVAAPSNGGPPPCAIRDLASLKACFAKPEGANRFVFEADVACGSDDECCAGDKGSILRLVSQHNKIIDGAGHSFRRRGGQRRCPAIQAVKSEGVIVNNLSLDEDEAAPPCELADANCPATIEINTSRNVKLDGVHVYFGKGSVVHVVKTNGFIFTHSSISEAGIIGLSVGHFQYGPSSNVVIEDSVIAHSRTNGVALEGAISDDPAAPVLIRRTILSGNHWHGLWPVANVAGGITSGGQLLVGDGRNIHVENNVFAGGACKNCKPDGQTVTAIEISDQASPPGGVYGLTIHHNVFLNGVGVAIAQNRGTALSDITISDNRVIGYSRLDLVAAPASRAGNSLAATRFDFPAGANGAIRFPNPGTHPVDSSHLEARAVVFGLSASPRPGAATAPLYRCLENGRSQPESVSTSLSCDSHGKVVAILGYVYEPGHSNAAPLYGCRSTGPDSDFFLSWDRACEGRHLVAELGYALSENHQQ
jgi:hypothetical protein